MPNIRKMNGGLLLNDTHESIEDAINFFKLHSTFSILTNSSRACITFKAELKDDIVSPFIHVRSGIIEQPVKTLLFKYFPVNTLNPKAYITFKTHKSRDRGNSFDYIRLAHISDIKKEYDIQLQVYQTTYNTISSAYEPVCPYPIHCFTDLDKEDTIQEIIDRLDQTKNEYTENNRIITEITDTLGGTIDSLITEADKAYIEYEPNKAEPIIRLEHDKARDSITTLGCIVMEFMDGYTTLQEYLNRLNDIRLEKDSETKKNKIIAAFGQSEYDNYNKDKAFNTIYDKVSEKAQSLASYELVRLKQIGFIHGDLHDQNIMYNPNYKYITNEDDDVKHKGRALIIDFGESLIDKKTLEEEEREFYSDDKDVLVNVYERGWDIALRFYPPYTFEMIYRKRLEVTLAFREKMIQALEQILTEHNALTTEKEKTKFVQDKKIQLKLGLITNSKKPTNFVLPNVDDFEKKEFDTTFKNVQFPIFETSNEKIQLLTQKRDEIIPKVQELIKLKPAPPPAELAAKPPLESKAKKAFNLLEHLTNKFTILFPPTPSVHGGSRYIYSHKNHKKQTAFSNRVKHRIRTTLRIKRRQTKRGKRGKRGKRKKRSKKGKRSKRKQ